MKALIWIGYFIKYTALTMGLMLLAIHFVGLLVAFVKMENVFYEMWVTEYDGAMTTLRGLFLMAVVVGIFGGTHDTNRYFEKKKDEV